MIHPTTARRFDPARLPFVFVVIAALASSWSSVKVFSKYNLTTGNYRLKQIGRRYEKVQVSVKGDSIEVFKRDNTRAVIHPNDHRYLQNNLDVDVLIAPFKYRPAQKNLPRQLNTSFNANLFFGYRLDRFHINVDQTHTGYTKTTTHSSLGFGIFGGISSIPVTPWTTNRKTTDEYDALGVCRGIMLLGGVDSLTFGLAMGFDRLTDRDKHVWIYQNKPWYGLTIGLNLN